MSGHVYLVGAGPGDPGLITIRGVEALRQADVVLYDRLVNPELLEYAPDALHEYVGKELGLKNLNRQEAINDRLIEHAKLGKTVVRLKGGDPFVFGRGGEEALALVAEGISFTVVPGVTSAVAAPASASIPVSHRGISSAFAVFAGREGLNNGLEDDHWRAAALIPTAVFLMGVNRLPIIVENLVRHGRSPKTPIALISQGTLSHQKVVVGTLETIVDLASGVLPPATIVVGETVAIRDQLLAHAVSNDGMPESSREREYIGIW